MRILSSSNRIQEAVDSLKAGEAVVYPTETFYGIGASALDERALERVTVLKGRPEGMPFPTLVGSLEMLKNYTDTLPERAEILIRKFWPGPLTLILKGRGLAPSVLGLHEGVGFRMSSHPVAQELVSKFGKPITTTSANRTGRPPCRTEDEVIQTFHLTDVSFLSSGSTAGGLPSTVVDMSGNPPIQLIRAGAIPWELVLNALNGDSFDG